MRASSTSRSVDGSSRPPSSPAATSSSSAKNALPPDRRVDRLEQRRVEVVAGDRPELRGRLGAGRSGSELDPLDAARPLELGEERQQRVAAVELVRAVGEQRASPPTSRRLRTRNPSRSRVERSDQWRSSTTNSDRRARGEPLEDARAAARTAGPGPTRCSGPDAGVLGDRAEVRARAAPARRDRGRATASSSSGGVRRIRPAQRLDDRRVRQARPSPRSDAAAREHDGALAPARGRRTPRRAASCRRRPRRPRASRRSGRRRRGRARRAGGRARPIGRSGRDSRRGRPCRRLSRPAPGPPPATTVAFAPASRSERFGDPGEAPDEGAGEPSSQGPVDVRVGPGPAGPAARVRLPRAAPASARARASPCIR